MALASVTIVLRVLQPRRSALATGFSLAGRNAASRARFNQPEHDHATNCSVTGCTSFSSPDDKQHQGNCMNNKFDELTKSMAQSVTRRAGLKKFGVGLGGMALTDLRTQ